MTEVCDHLYKLLNALSERLPQDFQIRVGKPELRFFCYVLHEAVDYRIVPCALRGPLWTSKIYSGTFSLDYIINWLRVK